MFWLQMLVVLIVASGSVYLFGLLKSKGAEHSYFYILSSFLAVVFFLRVMTGRDRFELIFALSNSPLNEGVTLISILLNWCTIANILLVILYPYFRNSRYSFLIKYFTGSSVLFVLLGLYVVTLGVVGEAAYNGFNFRTMLLAVEVGVLIASVISMWYMSPGVKVEKSDLWAFIYIPFMFLATMPCYILQAVFGYANYSVKVMSFEFPHRVILYLAIIIPILLYILLRRFDKKTIKGMLLYISLGTLVSFSLRFKFIDFADVTNLPFHLCNTAMYLIPLCLIFNLKTLFYFTYFINVFGAFIAMIMPNYSSSANIFSTSLVLFYVNHYIAFFMPILIVALRIFPRPKLKEFKYSVIGFAMYFIFVVIINAWFSNYGSVDYFFVNSDFVASKLGNWAENLRDVVWTVNMGNIKLVFYPLYQSLYFLIYLILSAIVWYLYENIYVSVDTIVDIVKRNEIIRIDKLANDVKMGKGWEERPVNKENVKKIVLSDFSKKYGNSETYAVENVNLEIKAGEVFGFLGHNGAGKSTIIKSIVGIQPITSGSISVCGYDVEKQSLMAKKQIGFVPDHYALYERLTGREYINYIADLYGVSIKDRDKAIKKYVTLFELDYAFDNQIKTYSHGMKQKITILSALVHNPKVWILDEPLTGLDPVSIYQVKKCLKEHAKAGNIVFFSSHLIDIVEQLCDKVAILKKGKILSIKNVRDIEKECSLEEYYLKITSEGRKDKIDVSEVEKVRW